MKKMTTRFWRTGLTLMALAAIPAVSQPAWARKNQPSAKETYAAMDSDPNALPADPELSARTPSPIEKRIKPMRRGGEAEIRRAERRAEPRQEIREAPHKPVAAPAFDPVPSDQIPGLTHRLKLVEALIRRHGRAYDYRVHTVKTLETVLARLEASTAEQPGGLQPESGPQAGEAMPKVTAPLPAPGSLPAPSEDDETGDAASAFGSSPEI